MPEAPADLIIEGRIATLRGHEGLGWAAAIAVRAGRVVAAGAAHEVRLLGGPRTSRWRLGREHVVLPSLTDAHLHLAAAARSARQPDLTGMDRHSATEAISNAHQGLLASGDRDGWLLGHGWAFSALGEHPHASWLDAAAPGRRVALWAHDHHARWLNSAALLDGGLVALDDPPGGRIERGPDGRPTGVMYETAAGLVDAVIPEPDEGWMEAAIVEYARTLAVLGVTSVHDPGDLAPDPSLRGGPVRYRSMAERDRLPLRVMASIREEQSDRAIDIGLRSGQTFGADGQARYRDGWLKLFADGALGSRTAALLAPYESDARAGPLPGGPNGMRLRTDEQLTHTATRAAAAGIASQIHAIGDAAVRSALDVIAKLPPLPGAMHRVEHAQLVDPADVLRFGQLGVAASVQPGHLISDAVAMGRAWGPRTTNAFPLAALSAAGTVLPLGTDAPVEAPDPWPGIAAAVMRRGPGTDPSETFHGAQSISLERALRAACLDGPRSARVDDLGHLAVGARADLVVLPAQVVASTADPTVLGSMRPLATVLDGALIHATAGFDP